VSRRLGNTSRPVVDGAVFHRPLTRGLGRSDEWWQVFLTTAFFPTQSFPACPWQTAEAHTDPSLATGAESGNHPPSQFPGQDLRFVF
jgi:hypothetical protein